MLRNSAFETAYTFLHVYCALPQGADINSVWQCYTLCKNLIQ